jgi:hypothetical protein
MELEYVVDKSVPTVQFGPRAAIINPSRHAATSHFQEDNIYIAQNVLVVGELVDEKQVGPLTLSA